MRGGNERLVAGDKCGVGKAAKVEVEVDNKFGDADQTQQARRDGKERSEDDMDRIRYG